MSQLESWIKRAVENKLFNASGICLLPFGMQELGGLKLPMALVEGRTDKQLAFTWGKF